MLGTPGPERETFRHLADCFALSSVLRQGGHENRVGGAGRDRTDDLRLAKAALPQLSYSPKWVVGLSGFEPLTLRLSGVRSNHLSYRPLTRGASGSNRYPIAPTEVSKSEDVRPLKTRQQARVSCESVDLVTEAPKCLWRPETERARSRRPWSP